MEDVQALVGRRIRKLRVAKGISQRELAKAASSSIAYIGALEMGRANPTIGVLASLAGALSTRVADLVIDAPTPKNRAVTSMQRLPSRVLLLADAISHLPAAKRRQMLAAVRAILRLAR